MKPSSLTLTADCRQISDILSRIGDKWTVLVISQLSGGPLRFNELKRRIGAISQKVLTATLRALERDGLAVRSVEATIPPRVEYALTPLGHDLLQSVRSLETWARANMSTVHEARQRYDGRAAGA